ncbi:hypothetical protein L7F22_010767 [Adiantum nelumboides]|nr:hypothetical protein [Adiantum nelumboides]
MATTLPVNSEMADANYSEGILSHGYYEQTCPQAEEIVQQQVERIYGIHGNSAVSFTRNIFHDCSVQGCDGSLLLDSLPGHAGEKDSDKNFGMRNYKYVNEIKEAIEQVCPGVVSCADILILSGRDGIAMLGGPHFAVKTGRRDTRNFSVDAADSELLPHDADVDAFLIKMAGLNVNISQAVALAGAHMVGRTHCKHLVDRLYPTVDPTLDADYSTYLKTRCPTQSPDPKAVEYSRNDPITPMKFDNNYYKNVMNKKGLLRLDNGLYLDERTKPYVELMAQNNDYFFEQFVEGISILSEHNVLTGSHGEIRKHCQFLN